MNQKSSGNSKIRDVILLYDKITTPKPRSDKERKQAFLVGGVVFGLLLLIPLVINGFVRYGPTLWILAFVVTFGSLIAGTFLLIRSYTSGDREHHAINEEIEAMASDASFDVSEQIIFWDKIKLTKGVGTQLEGRDEEISEIYRRLLNARAEIAAAESSQHRLEAVLAADALLATARSLR